MQLTDTRAKAKAVSLGFTTAMAAVLLAGCANTASTRADLSSAASQQALASAQRDSAIGSAEAAVLADPRNAARRMALGNAYLDAGRFASAETAFRDAMELGDTSPRAALSLALAQIAQQDYARAAALLNEWEGEIARADLGLALALSGQPERGIHIMSNAIRGGENTVKMRQNLAYAFAIAGRWREARLMAQQDLPAGEVNARMEQWAALASADAYERRIAGLLQVPSGVRDMGQPAQLALANTPAASPAAADGIELAASGADELPEIATAEELAALDAALDKTIAPAARQPVAEPAPRAAGPQESIATIDPTPTQTPVESFEQAFAESHAHGPVAGEGGEGARFFSSPVVQQVPSRADLAQASQARADAPDADAPTASLGAAEGTHLIQLGSFASERGAERAWDIYLARFPELANHDMVISEAVVDGRRFWRVSAGGFDRTASHAMCRRVRSASGDDCITWASARPLPGAVETGTRLARR